MKTDLDIKNLVTAAIVRHAMHMDQWTGTRLADAGDPHQVLAKITLAPAELPILSSRCADDAWTVLSTRRAWSCHGGKIDSIALTDLSHVETGAFKGPGETALMHLRTNHGERLLCPYQSGFASMGVVSGVNTLRGLLSMQ